jgi:hypothetical protein
VTINLWPLLTVGPLSLKCLMVGHDDSIRRAPARMYLECQECGRETTGWRLDLSSRINSGPFKAITHPPDGGLHISRARPLSVATD